MYAKMEPSWAETGGARKHERMGRVCKEGGRERRRWCPKGQRSVQTVDKDGTALPKRREREEKDRWTVYVTQGKLGYF